MEKINIRGVNFLNTTLDGAAEYIWQRFADGEQTVVAAPRHIVHPDGEERPNLRRAHVTDFAADDRAASSSAERPF